MAIEQVLEQSTKNELDRQGWENRFLELYFMMHDGYVALSSDLFFIDANPAFQSMVGYSLDELRRMTLMDITPSKWLAYEQDIMRKAQEACDAVGTYEKEFLKRDGKLLPVEVSAYVKRNTDGEVTGYWALIKNLADKKTEEAKRAKIEEQLQQAQRVESLGIFASGVAHDFNNLLTGIVGHTSLALAKMSDVAPGRENVEMIDKAAQKLTELTRQLLAFSGQGKYVIKPISVSMLVEEMAYMMHQAVGEHIKFEVAIDNTVPLIEGDATQLRQLIQNLVNNAVDAIGDQKGIIRVTTGSRYCDRGYLSSAYLSHQVPEGTYVYVEVQDTGCGIDPQTIQRMFDPFFTTKFTGRGLGLAAVLGIIKGHNGTCRISSQIGAGTSFTVLFPKTEKGVHLIAEAERAKEFSRYKGFALVVDDEDTVRDLAKAALEQNGFKVLTAHDGEEAVEVFRNNAPDISCVLLDMTMPRMSGEETFKELKRIKDDVRVILSSGFNEPENQNRFTNEGIAGFLNKPYRLEELITKVREVLTHQPSFH